MPRSEAAEEARAWLPLAFGHLAVLWAFAIVQPLLDVLGDTPEFFVARGNTRGDILLLALGLTLVPPAALVCVELLVSRLRGARRAVHLAFVAVLSAAIALQTLERAFSGLGAAAAFAAAAAAGALAAFAYARVQGLRSFLTALTPAPALFLPGRGGRPGRSWRTIGLPPSFRKSRCAAGCACAGPAAVLRRRGQSGLRAGAPQAGGLKSPRCSRLGSSGLQVR